MAEEKKSTMQALVYSSTSASHISVSIRPRPTIISPTDAIVRLTATTICGTDLHILKGDVSTCKPDTILGHEGIGTILAVGPSVALFQPGDRVLIVGITSCSVCAYCRRGMPSHCTTGGWKLGNKIDGTQAEYVRVPHADGSLHKIPDGVDERMCVMLSDIFPTGLECGVLNGKVKPGCTVAIVGAGPVGLAALVTAQMYSPGLIIAIDTDQTRLKVAKNMGADHIINPAGREERDVVAEVKGLADGVGYDTVIEAVGVPGTFEMAQRLLAPGGTLANVGVHGTSARVFLEDLWDKGISITTGLVDCVSTPMLLKLVKLGKLDPSKLITHRFKFTEIEKAYETFGAASKHEALKVLIEMDS